MNAFKPDWSLPSNIGALVTTCEGGVSIAPYTSLNLGDHVGDAVESVQANRSILRQSLPANPIWLKQVHGTAVSTPLSRQTFTGDVIEADAAVTNIAGEVLSIMTADCLPVLFVSKDGKVIGAAHAGWRGACNGVLENTVSQMLALEPNLLASNLLVWLGPAIGPQSFEVGAEVLEAFIQSGQEILPGTFTPIADKPSKYLANLYLLAKSRLKALGIHHIDGGNFCTYQDSRFFSYRRDGVTGRFASLIWINPQT